MRKVGKPDKGCVLYQTNPPIRIDEIRFDDRIRFRRQGFYQKQAVPVGAGFDRQLAEDHPGLMVGNQGHDRKKRELTLAAAESHGFTPGLHGFESIRGTQLRLHQLGHHTDALLPLGSPLSFFPRPQPHTKRPEYDHDDHCGDSH
ncbi:MAG: hypothetical protein CSA23_02925 [Deltaproteobacteria bacterium]|nr:MAG: hypothetical protein CSA23_02925 [Deltaproteobacteria bacterium]